MQRLLNRLRELLLLASLPLILFATLYALVMLFWLVLILLAGATQISGLLLLPAIYTFVPTSLWNSVGLTPFVQLPKEQIHVLTVGPGHLWPAKTLDFLQAAGTGALHSSWPYILAIVALWLMIGFRHQSLWIAIATRLNTLPPGAAPWLEDQLRVLSRAAGLPVVPRLSIWHEDAPNAFASGLGPATYKVTVTTGLIQRLTPRELQAVLAHELGHIHAGDVRLLTLCYVYGGIFGAIADYLWLNVSHSLRGEDSPYNRLFLSIPLVAMAALVFSFAGGLATLIRSLLIRGRELQADRYAAQLTGDPLALSLALHKIAAYKAPPPKARLVRDSVIHAPARYWWQRWTATHPPMEKRQKALKIGISR